ncbi:MAG TPA: RNA 2',3'-cyclic phosphodiesterase [Aggregatilineaceae bacterium]|nr:RNA 2',3'-cyclic phosphodiesterase [Aggregatilineaceae bacterium]
MTEMWRLFIALELPPHVLEELTSIQTNLKRQIPPQTVRWVDPKGIHLTLKFLGDAPVSQRETLQNKLSEAAQQVAPFDLTAGGLGCFPNLKRPRVVWVGIHGSETLLNALQQAVEDHIAPLGYPTEDRAFNPHLTLGRVRQDADRNNIAKLGDLISRALAGQPQSWTVQHVSLIRSELKPSGAVYTVLFHAPLK